MSQLPGAVDLTAAEFVSLSLVAPGFMSRRTIPRAHQALIELGLIRSAMGDLFGHPGRTHGARTR